MNSYDKRLMIGRLMYLAAQTLVVVADAIQPKPKELNQ